MKATSSLLAQDVSLRRIAGFACDRLWVFMMFYSIVPFVSVTDVRESLYLHQTVSLSVMAVTLVVIAAISRRQARLGANHVLVWVAAALMAGGSALALLAEIGTSTGMLVLAVAGFATGVGSALLLAAWLEALAEEGPRLAIVEFALATCLGFLAGLVLLFAPAAVSVVTMVVIPLLSAWVLQRATADRQQWASMRPYAPLSHKARALFIKGLVGIFMFGVLEGFFDSFTGYSAFAVEDFHGINLFLWGFISMFAVAVLGVFNRHDALFYTYRLAMMLMCLGCLTSLYLGDGATLSGGVIFAGFLALMVVIFVVCVNVSSSFSVGLTRSLACGFAALYAGEVAGGAAVMAADGATLANMLEPVTIVAVAWLFFANLFLFTETDLIRVGLGEVEAEEVANQPMRDEVQQEQPTPDEPTASANEDMLCETIASRYALSPREAEVLPLLLQGRTIARIQETLYISAGTVSTHIRHIYQKTGAENRQALLDLAEQVRLEGSPTAEN